jgi:uncharacterized membrane protein
MSYTIIGGDKKEYGPISADDVRQWIAEGRLNAQSLAKGDTDTAWRTVASFPEFAEVLAGSTPPTIGALRPATPGFSAPVSMDFLDRDYEIDMGGCVARGWTLVTQNMGILFVGALVYWGIQFGAGVLGNIPLLGIIIKIANFVISGALMGGLYYLSIRVIRGEPAQVGDVFAGFTRAFGQLFLNVLVQTILLGICLLPFIIVLIIKMMPLVPHLQELRQGMQNGTPPSPEIIDLIKSAVFVSLPVFLVCMIPSTYLGVCWKFSLALIMDKQMDFWTAMKTSWKMVNKHWWQVFGVVLLIGLLNLAGVVLCCLPVLFTFPVGIAALMYAYETIFGARKT